MTYAATHLLGFELFYHVNYFKAGSFKPTSFMRKYEKFSHKTILGSKSVSSGSKRSRVEY